MKVYRSGYILPHPPSILQCIYSTLASPSPPGGGFASGWKIWIRQGIRMDKNSKLKLTSFYLGLEEEFFFKQRYCSSFFKVSKTVIRQSARKCGRNFDTGGKQLFETRRV